MYIYVIDSGHLLCSFSVDISLTDNSKIISGGLKTHRIRQKEKFTELCIPNYLSAFHYPNGEH